MEKNRSKFKQAEIGMIPEDWEIINLDMVKFVKGRKPKEISLEPQENYLQQILIDVLNGAQPTYAKMFDGAVVCKKSDLIMVMDGASSGRIANGFEGILGSTLAIVKQKNNIIDNKFLYFIFLNKQSELRGNTTGSAIPHTDKNRINSMKIAVPKSQEEQQAIAKILSDLDEKIELNQQMNKTLEEIGQAIFEYWFVDFEFPNEEGKPYKSSGGEIVYSEELGKEIPKGWKVGKLEDMLTISIGGDWGEDKEFKDSIPVICLRGTDLQSLKESGYSLEAPVRWITKTSLEKRQIASCDILIGGSGLGPIGRSIYFHNAIKNLYDYPISYSNFCKKLNAQNQENAIYSEIIIENMYNSWEMSKYFTGTSVPNLDANGLLTENIIVPQDNLLKQFAQFVQLKLSHHYKKENQTLSQIRDSLLPKLMSGKIRVKDVF
jgi:type I restriction enzyme S subunit